jgi:hypothetical protein
MANIQVAQAALKEPPKLTDAEVAYNQQVAEFVATIKLIASDVKDDMKERQFTSGLKGEKVYSQGAANRSTLNRLASLINKSAEKAEKLKKGGTKKGGDGFIGFAIPGYIKPEMAREIGLNEGTILWPQGQKPIFSAGNITRFFTHRAVANGLIYPDDLAKFRCDDSMRKLFGPYVLTSVKPGKPPIDLDRLTYTGIQQLITNFVEKRSKETPGPKIEGELATVFKQLEAQFAQLKVLKDEVTEAFKKEAKAKNDVIKAKAALDAGHITQELYAVYHANCAGVMAEKERVYETYRVAAKKMGI